MYIRHGSPDKRVRERPVGYQDPQARGAPAAQRRNVRFDAEKPADGAATGLWRPDQDHPRRSAHSMGAPRPAQISRAPRCCLDRGRCMLAFCCSRPVALSCSVLLARAMHIFLPKTRVRVTWPSRPVEGWRVRVANTDPRQARRSPPRLISVLGILCPDLRTHQTRSL